MSSKHPDSALIDKVGARAVADVFGLTPQALHMWRKRGIPLAKRIAFAKLAADNTVAVPHDFYAKFEVGSERAA